MASTDSFADYVVLDLLGHIQGVSSRKMFGGYGIYKEDVMFGLIAKDVLYFRVDESNIADYEELDSKPFIYEHKTRKPVTMPYYILPDEVLEDSDVLSLWVEKSVKINKKKKKI